MNTDPDYLTMLGYIAQMPDVDQTTIKNIKDKIYNIIIEDKDLGIAAFTLIALELRND
jgi:hypothetical protein